MINATVLIKALMNTLMGMGTVFVVLIFISLIISRFKYIPNLERALKNKRKGKAAQDTAEEARPAPKRPILNAAEEIEAEELEGDELIAVIMAAIVASSGGAVSADRLRIHSVRKVRRR